MSSRGGAGREKEAYRGELNLTRRTWPFSILAAAGAALAEALDLARDSSATVLGITLSSRWRSPGADPMQAGLAERAKFRLADYRAVEGASTASFRSACSSMSALAVTIHSSRSWKKVLLADFMEDALAPDREIGIDAAWRGLARVPVLSAFWASHRRAKHATRAARGPKSIDKSALEGELMKRAKKKVAKKLRSLQPKRP